MILESYQILSNVRLGKGVHNIMPEQSEKGVLKGMPPKKNCFGHINRSSVHLLRQNISLKGFLEKDRVGNRVTELLIDSFLKVAIGNPNHRKIRFGRLYFGHFNIKYTFFLLRNKTIRNIDIHCLKP